MSGRKLRDLLRKRGKVSKVDTAEREDADLVDEVLRGFASYCLQEMNSATEVEFLSKMI